MICGFGSSLSHAPQMLQWHAETKTISQFAYMNRGLVNKSLCGVGLM